ncbi:hypothetical protein [Chiayiivirga flava]|uniref:Uncharacterized protein n=1 Tax=Chiayiivirga flava TaxID=659595 RepID=A0A7W8D2S7_9GAMM|nr:hypothetical protein [Chiayiivirga flava]MBB5206861.1 hypothetical protein [Chiayiivirga flava]
MNARHLGQLVLAMSLVALDVASVRADNSGQDIIDAGNRTIDLIGREIFHPHLSENERRLFSEQRISVRPAADFNAYVDYQNERILIPGQMLAEVQLQIHGQIMVFENPSLAGKYADWLYALAERTARAARRIRDKQAVVDDIPIESFWHFAGVPQPRGLTPRQAVYQSEVFIDLLSFIVGHELGHLALGHGATASAGNRAAQEYAADAYALNLMQRSGRSVLPVISHLYMRFIAMEAVTGEAGHSSSRSHPPSQCRIHRIGHAELAGIMQSPAARANYERTTGMSVETFYQQLREFARACEETSGRGDA